MQRIASAAICLLLAGCSGNGHSAPDITPPVFEGLKSVRQAGSDSILLSWQPGADDRTPASRLRYLVFLSEIEESFDYTRPVTASPAGATSHPVSGLAPNKWYYFSVRAMDLSGNTDINKVQLKGIIDVTPPSFSGVEGAIARSNSELFVWWKDASDDLSKPGEISYMVFVSVQPGVYDFSSPATVAGPGATSCILGGLERNRRYYVAVKARDAAGNTEGNSVETFADTIFWDDLGGPLNREASRNAYSPSVAPGGDSPAVAWNPLPTG
jgi:hypothetical protein